VRELGSGMVRRIAGFGVEGLDDGFGMTRESDNAGDLPGEFEVGGEREFGLLRRMLRGCVSVRAIGKGEDDLVMLRGPRGRCMIVSLLAVVASCGQGDNITAHVIYFGLNKWSCFLIHHDPVRGIHIVDSSIILVLLDCNV
jgi:hypothetical protein